MKWFVPFVAVVTLLATSWSTVSVVADETVATAAKHEGKKERKVQEVYDFSSLYSMNRNGSEIIDQTFNPQNVTAREPTGQERLDTIVKAFRHLPPDELEKLPVNLNSNISAGTTEAELLFEAWRERQVLLKQAMQSMVQPVELMGNITRLLVDESVSLLDKTERLDTLEQLLDDIDNARDFHTIGGWTVLDQSLSQYLSRPDSAEPTTTALARWPQAFTTDEDTQATRVNEELSLLSLVVKCFGTVVKNSYDYQLWTTTKSSADATQTVLDSLLALMHQSYQRHQKLTASMGPFDSLVDEQKHVLWPQRQLEEDLQKRLLYSISAAIRGNIDVQNYVLQHYHKQAEAAVFFQPSSGSGAAAGDSKGATEAAATADSLHHAGLQLEIFDLLYNMSVAQYSTLEIPRKIWSFVADALEERQYIRNELQLAALNEFEHLQTLLSSSSSSSSSSSASDRGTGDSASASGGDEKLLKQIEERRALLRDIYALQRNPLLGDHFLASDWSLASWKQLRSHFADLETTTALAAREEEDLSRSKQRQQLRVQKLQQQHQQQPEVSVTDERTAVTETEAVARSESEVSVDGDGSQTSEARLQASLESVMAKLQIRKHRQQKLMVLRSLVSNLLKVVHANVMAVSGSQGSSDLATQVNVYEAASLRRELMTELSRVKTFFESLVGYEETLQCLSDIEALLKHF